MKLFESHYQEIFRLITKDWKKMTLDQMLDLAGEQAGKALLNRKVRQLMPTWLLINSEDEMFIVGTPWEDDREKQRMVKMVKQKIKQFKVVQYSFLTEAWTAKAAVGQLEKDLRPSQRPDRQEVVLALATDGKETKYRQWKIKRDYHEQIIALEPDSTYDDATMESWLSELLN